MEMRRLIFAFVCLCCLMYAENICAQQHPCFRDLIQPADHENEVKLSATLSDQSLLDLLFFVYKRVISSQDVNHCNFSPSCSEYAVKAIAAHGLLAGGIMTFDRLSRCHGHASADQYEKLHGKYSDPP